MNDVSESTQKKNAHREEQQQQQQQTKFEKKAIHTNTKNGKMRLGKKAKN